ncbi:hypothetical protein PUN28_017895 [Cardiocondyla obscurior]|uniref:Uncharacterized protein n=1 Tax=Cardiocondyla obscurior TaxID=286306 RepID=A0AAW2EJF5_9HYME
MDQSQIETNRRQKPNKRFRIRQVMGVPACARLEFPKKDDLEDFRWLVNPKAPYIDLLLRLLECLRYSELCGQFLTFAILLRAPLFYCILFPLSLCLIYFWLLSEICLFLSNCFSLKMFRHFLRNFRVSFFSSQDTLECDTALRAYSCMAFRIIGKYILFPKQYVFLSNALLHHLSLELCNWLDRLPNIQDTTLTQKPEVGVWAFITESHSYSRRLPALHWAEITLRQHPRGPSQCFVLIRQSDSPSPCQF